MLQIQNIAQAWSSNVGLMTVQTADYGYIETTSPPNVATSNNGGYWTVFYQILTFIGQIFFVQEGDILPALLSKPPLDLNQSSRMNTFLLFSSMIVISGLVALTVFLDCLSTMFKTGPVFSKHYTQLAQPHTQLAKHYRSFAKLNTPVKTIHFFLKTTLCYYMKHTRFTLLYSVCTSYTLLW